MGVQTVDSKVIVTTTLGGNTVLVAPPQPTLVSVPVGRQGEQGPPGTINVVELTQGQYADLTEKVPNTIYVIT